MFQKCEESGTYLALPWSEEQNQEAAGCGYTISDSCSYFPEHVSNSESPYAQVPVFPLISKQDAKTLVKPKKDMQKQTRQRKKELVSSKEIHFSIKKKQVQEVRDMGSASAICNSSKGSLRSLKTYVLFDQAVAKASGQSSKKKCSPAINSESPNKRRHPPTASKGKAQAHVSVKSSSMLCTHSLHISSPFSAVALSYTLLAKIRK